MLRRQNNTRRYNRSRKPRGRQLSRTANGFTQNGAGVSHMDNVSQVRKFQLYKNLPFDNASSDYALGLTNINIKGTDLPMKAILNAYSGFYEQYRIRKINVRAQVGKGYTNDRRIKTLIGCRVDPDQQLTASTVQNVQSINASENTVIKTFTERGNILLAKYRPQMRAGSNVSLPMLPNRFQFYPIKDASNHSWKGATITCLLPEPSLQVNTLGITIITEVDIEFRGRISDPLIFSSNTINSGAEVISYDLETPQLDMRTAFLTGQYTPLTGFANINVANIGYPDISDPITAEQIVGATFRVNNTNEKYSIEVYEGTVVKSNLIVE